MWIVLLGIMVAVLMMSVAHYSTCTPPTDCAEQIAAWSVDETSHVDLDCR